jgi:hypothetical protein
MLRRNEDPVIVVTGHVKRVSYVGYVRDEIVN